jgi:peroxiredoxin
VERSLGGTFDVVRTEDEGNPDYPRRKTFLIDPEGTIRKIYTVTDTAAHPDEVLADINQMSAAG